MIITSRRINFLVLSMIRMILGTTKKDEMN